jgi:hypothetical protein
VEIIFHAKSVRAPRAANGMLLWRRYASTGFSGHDILSVARRVFNSFAIDPPPQPPFTLFSQN